MARYPRGHARGVALTDSYFERKGARGPTPQGRTFALPQAIPRYAFTTVDRQCLR
jgi:hypothetical protein